MQAKLKKCDGCHEDKPIWKKHGRERFCQSCWSKHPDKSLKPLKTKAPIKSKSSKQEKLENLYGILRKAFLTHNPFCKAKLKGCQLNATDVHHMAGRGKYLLDDALFLPVCRMCHGQIEENPIMAKHMGFSVSRDEVRTQENDEENQG